MERRTARDRGDATGNLVQGAIGRQVDGFLRRDKLARGYLRDKGQWNAPLPRIPQALDTMQQGAVMILLRESCWEHLLGHRLPKEKSAAPTLDWLPSATHADGYGPPFCLVRSSAAGHGPTWSSVRLDSSFADDRTAGFVALDFADHAWFMDWTRSEFYLGSPCRRSIRIHPAPVIYPDRPRTKRPSASAEIVEALHLLARRVGWLDEWHPAEGSRYPILLEIGMAGQTSGFPAHGTRG
jgi:hypothetical protein